MSVATPPDSMPVPMLDPPSRNMTDPVGVPVPGATGVTVAVNVTGTPAAAEFAELVTVVVVSAWSTV